MARAEAIGRLGVHEAELTAMGVEHLVLFGSTARDEAGPDSDLEARHPAVAGRDGAAIGNVIRHGCESVPHQTIWNLVRGPLVAIEQACRAESAALPEEDRTE
jgi:hypothetical protein